MPSSFSSFPTLAAAIEDAAKADPTLGFRFISEAGVPGFGAGAAHSSPLRGVGPPSAGPHSSPLRGVGPPSAGPQTAPLRGVGPPSAGPHSSPLRGVGPPSAGPQSEASFSYTALERASARYGGALQALGLVKGDRVALVLPTNEDFVLCFFGAIRAGIIPVPIYPPVGLGQLQSYLDNTRHVVLKSGARAIVTTAQIKRLLGTVQASSPSLEQVVAVEAIRESLEPLKPAKIDPGDVAFLQFTSGSTSRPKGVTLTHANLMSNIECIVRHGLRMTSDDVGVSWLPLYHDMGLIGFVLSPLAMRTPIVFLPPLLFLKRPITWFQAVTRHKGTVSFAPNFAYALCVKRIRERDLDGIDLSSWRVAGCGAEPIRPETLESFARAFAKVAFDANALLPSYGMAESSLAISFSALGEGVKTIAVDGEALWADNVAKRVADSAEGAVRLVSCGRSFPDHDIAVFSPEEDAGDPLPEGRVGEIRIKGPSVMPAYWEDAERTKQALSDGWLKSGDLGFLLDGELYICGRSKEVVIVNGRNYYPQDIEWLSSQVPGVRKGNVIAFGASDRSEPDRERVVVAFECQDVPKTAEAQDLAREKQALCKAVRKAVQEGMALTLDDVVPLAPGILPKTSSGKLQRAKTRELYETGELARRKPARDADRLEILREAARSQLSYFKLAVLGGRKRD